MITVLNVSKTSLVLYNRNSEKKDKSPIIHVNVLLIYSMVVNVGFRLQLSVRV